MCFPVSLMFLKCNSFSWLLEVLSNISRSTCVCVIGVSTGLTGELRPRLWVQHLMELTKQLSLTRLLAGQTVLLLTDCNADCTGPMLSWIELKWLLWMDLTGASWPLSTYIMFSASPCLVSTVYPSSRSLCGMLCHWSLVSEYRQDFLK